MSLAHDGFRVLFASSGAARPGIRVDEEYRVIVEALNRASHSDAVEITRLPVLSFRSLSRALLRRDFNLLHLSCHGHSGGLVIDDDDEAHMLMTAADLSELLSEYARPRGLLECLLVNACDSVSLEPFVAPIVPTTVLMTGTVDDRAALRFSEGFYDALGAGRTLAFAYREGRRRARVLARDALLEARLQRGRCVGGEVE